MEHTVFATLTPANALTKLAFDDFVEANVAGLQDAQRESALGLLRLWVGPKHDFDKEGFILRAHQAQLDAFEGDSGASDASESLPEPESEVEREHKEHGLAWQGNFLLAFDPQPSELFLGWTVGEHPVGDAPKHAFLLLCMRAF